jgi:transposase
MPPTAASTNPPTGRNPEALKALEDRRRQAARLFAKGRSQAEVARALGVSAQTSHRWHAHWQQGGTRALRASPHSGRPARLTPAQLQRLRQAIIQPEGARRSGMTSSCGP